MDDFTKRMYFKGKEDARKEIIEILKKENVSADIINKIKENKV